MEIREEPIGTRKVYRIICSCPLCKVDFTITTNSEYLCEIIGTPDMAARCPFCTGEAIVDDKEEDYI